MSDVVQQRGNRKRRVLARLMSVVLLVAMGALGWSYISPMLGEKTAVHYAAYTVERANLATEKNFSASISVLNSETHTNTTGATSIKEMYVSGGQTVKKGDKLMLLDDGTLLEAGLDGVVNEMRFGQGDWLWQNISLIQVCDLENLKVTLSVDEYDVENVSPGQTCYVHIIPLGIDFETKIRHVNRVSSASGQVAYYTATAELAVPEYVLPGMSASVTIPAEKRENTLVLDMAALAFDEEGKPYTLRKEGDAYTRVMVETGLSNGMQVEILSGLEEGEQVWAVDGEETVETGFSLVELYKRIAGEKVVINDMSGSRQGSRGSGTFPAGMTMPEGFPTEETGRNRPTATGTDLPGGMNLPEGFPQRERSGRERPGLASGTDMPGHRQPGRSAQPDDSGSGNEEMREREGGSTR